MAGLETVRDLRLEVKNRLEAVFQQLTSSNFLEMFFADMIVPQTPESEAEKRQFTIQEIMNIFRSATNRVSVPCFGVNHESQIQLYITNAENGEKPEMLFNNVLSWRMRSENVDLLIKDLINTLIQSQFLSLRSVCEVLLTSPDLKISNEKLWTDTLEYIDKSISRLDYKSFNQMISDMYFDLVLRTSSSGTEVTSSGTDLHPVEPIVQGVRDVFKLLLDHISNCPSKFSVDSRQNHLLIENMILRICDRKENLLPAYFIINEIRKQYYEPKCFPHWRVAACFSDVVESFRQLGQMVTPVGRSCMLPVPGHFGLYLNTSWKLDPATLKFYMKGTLPFPMDVHQPQNYIIHQIILQPSFRELSSVLLSLQGFKQQVRFSMEEIFVSTILELMAEVEREGRLHRQVWSTLGSVSIFLFINNLIVFPKLIRNLQIKLSSLPYRKARDDLMWFLMQCLSGLVSKIQVVDDITAILDLYRVLYTGSEEFSVSESDPSCVYMMAATCVWVLVLERYKEMNADPNSSLQNLEIPPSIKTQITFLQESRTKAQLSLDNCFMFATFCNAYSTSKEIFQVELAPMIFEFLEHDRLSNAPNLSTAINLPGGLLADGKIAPLKTEFLDSITTHVRMSIIHTLMDTLKKFIQSKTQLHLSPALIETYSRLLSYLDIEHIALNKFVSNLINEAFKVGNAEKQMFLQQQQQNQQTGQFQQSLPVSKTGSAEFMYIACEIVSYRLIQAPTGYRSQIFSSFFPAAFLFNNNVQFFWTLESTKARQIIWLPLQDVVQSAFLKTFAQQTKESTKTLFHENEDLCKLMMLTIAKAYAVSGGDGLQDENYRNLLLQFPQHYFSKSTLDFFPVQLTSVYLNVNAQSMMTATSLSSRQPLYHVVDQDYIKTWRSSANDVQLLEYFARRQSPKTFLCIIWRHLYENAELPHIAYRILHELGPRNIFLQLPSLIDFILVDINNLNIPQCVESLSKMVWKYAIVPLDWLVLTAVLRPFDSTDGFYAILLAFLLLQNEEFLCRVQECCNTMSPEFWRNGAEVFEKHAAYHQKYPEKLWSNVLSEQLRGAVTQAIMPTYFGNVCFAILPVLDLLLQRIIESPDAHDKIFNKLLDSVGQLYKFHPQPITFLYNTLRFYEKCLVDKPELKQKLVYTIHMSLVPVRGENWLLSNEFLKICQLIPQQQQSGSPDATPMSEQEYFGHTVKRLVDCFSPTTFDSNPRPAIDWRFFEFSGPQPYVLHALCVELMSLSFPATHVGSVLIDVFLQSHPLLIRKDVNKWLNALGLIFSTLSVNYCSPLYDRIAECLVSGQLDSWSTKGTIFAKLNFEKQYLLTEDILPCRLMALAHSVWLQVTSGYLNVLPQRLRDRFRSLVQTETQFLYLFHLVAPFLQRLHQERSKLAVDLATDFYEMLLVVDNNLNGESMQHEDTICDLVYHIKYMYVGDSIRLDTDRIIPQLKSVTLQNKLRFIGHHQMEGGSTVPPS